MSMTRTPRARFFEPFIHFTSPDPPTRNNFSFKCHRKDSSPTVKDQSVVFAVNDISFHPIHGTFSTCGM